MTSAERWGGLALLLLLLPGLASAQSPYEPDDPLPIGSVLATLPSSHVAPAGTWNLGFMHRFLAPASEGSFSDQLHALFGLDGGANVAFGASWVPRRDLELSLFRTNTLDEFEIAAKYVVVQQAPAIPATLALRGGADWRTERELSDRVSWFAQAIVSRTFGDRVELSLVPTYVTDSGRASDGTRSFALFSNAFNVGVGGVVMIGTGLSVMAEVIPTNGDLPVDGDPGWALALKKVVGGHHFEVLLTNSPAMTTSEWASSSFLGAPLDAGDVHLGFNIRRQLGRSR